MSYKKATDKKSDFAFTRCWHRLRLLRAKISVVFHRTFDETVSTVASMFQPHNNRETPLTLAGNMKHET